MELVCEIPVGHKIAIVDNYFGYLSKYRWTIINKYYAAAYMDIDGKKKQVLMHRFILGAECGKSTDHINGNCLDNRRANLRVCTNTENLRNRKIHKNNKCGFKGVYWEKTRAIWVVSLRFNKKHYTVGRFKNIIDAANAYNNKAIELFGEFARLNVLWQNRNIER